jgi:hypothetical protein
VYYQLTKRRGHTHGALRRLAREVLAEEKEQITGQ